MRSRVPMGRAGTATLLGVTALVPNSFCWCPELPWQMVTDTGGTATDTGGGGCPCGGTSGCGAGDSRDAAHGERSCRVGKGIVLGDEGVRGWEGSERVARQVEKGDKRMKALKIKAKNRNVSQEHV